jgi:hypothetical protein
MPLSDWSSEHRAWDPPFDALNPYPRLAEQLCEN